MSKKYTGYDFCGWATRNDIRCTDGRTIKRDAFAHQDGVKVPIVWGHDHDSPDKVIGHGFLENRNEGVYIYGYLNNGPLGRAAKEDIEHGDITNLSIWANHLTQKGGDVIHGSIKEVSLVLSGANIGATIEYPIVAHGDDYSEDYSEAFIYLGDEYVIKHSDEDDEPLEDKNSSEEVIAHEDEKGGEKMPNNEKTIKEIFDEMTEEQKQVVYYLVGAAKEGLDEEDKDEDEVEHSDYEGDDLMKFNAFDMQGTQSAPAGYISHDDMNQILKDAKTCGSLKEAVENHMDHGVLQHADYDGPYGVEPIDYLFPEARNLNTPPEFIQRDTGWVSEVMSGVHKTPFSRIKSMFANITEDEARALGYIKGHYKKEEVFTLLKRTTSPQTIYKKQKFDRDDLIDITDFDMIAWIKREMRMMLDEELARAYLIGDGRLSSSDDKISEAHIRPIVSDDDLFSIKVKVTPAANADDNAKAKAIVRAIIKARKNYKGSGNPTFFTTEDVLTDLLLIEDTTGRVIYDSMAKLESALRVSKIVTVPVMEGVTGPQGGPLVGIIVNLKDYNVGADRGGEVNMFDDFDIDYNQQKYLIETRCSGALIKPFSAIVVEMSGSGSTTTTYTAVEPEDGDSPMAEGWYEKAANGYMKSEDATVRANKTYYKKTTA